MNNEQRLRLVADAQQEIINVQRMYILDLEKKLPQDDHVRWRLFLEHAMKRLEDIHSKKIPEETSCKTA